MAITLVNLDSLARRIADRWCSEFVEEVLEVQLAELSPDQMRSLRVKLLRLGSERLALVARKRTDADKIQMLAAPFTIQRKKRITNEVFGSSDAFRKNYREPKEHLLQRG